MIRIQVSRPGMISSSRTFRATRFLGRARASTASTGPATDESRVTSLTRVDRRHPVPEGAQPASYRVEIGAADLPRHWPHVSIAHRPMVDRGDRGDLRAGTAQEDLLGNVQLGPVDQALPDRELEVLRDR